MSAAPPMAITMGDASGVGPEIVLRTAAAGGLDDHIVVYGDASILFSGQRLLGTSVPIRAIEMPGDLVPGDLNVIDLRMLRPSQHRPGELSAEAGAAARAYVERATIDALQGRVAGLVTMPMNKEATQLSDPRFVGHTEMIAELCGAPRVTMMLTNGSIAVTHVSTHCALREAIDRVRADRVLDVIELTNAALSRFLAKPARRGVRLEPTCRRARALRVRGRGAHRAGDRRGTRRGDRRVRVRIPPTPSSSRRCTKAATTRSSACITTKVTRR